MMIFSEQNISSLF